MVGGTARFSSLIWKVVHSREPQRLMGKGGSPPNQLFLVGSRKGRGGGQKEQVCPAPSCVPWAASGTSLQQLLTSLVSEFRLQGHKGRD